MKGFQLCNRNKQFPKSLLYLTQQKSSPHFQQNMAMHVLGGGQNLKEIVVKQENTGDNFVIAHPKAQQLEETRATTESELLRAVAKLPHSENKTKTINKSIQSRYKKSQLKNYLCCFKKCLLRIYLKEVPLEKQDSEIVRFLATPNTNRFQVEKLMRDPQLRPFLRMVFHDKILQRQMQFSRIGSLNRRIYIEKINLLKLAFIVQKLNHL